MKNLFRAFSSILVCLSISIANIHIYAEDIETVSETETVTRETFELELTPKNYATVILDSPSSNYSRKPLSATINKAYGNVELNARWATVLADYDVPLKDALTGIKECFYMMLGNESGSRHLPLYFDLNPIPDTLDKTSGQYKDATVEENETSNAIYSAWSTYVKDEYWNNSSTDWTLAAKISNISGEKLHSFDVTDTALEALKAGPTSYITFATGTASNYYYNYRLKTRSGYLPKLILTYSTEDVLTYINSATDENILEMIKNTGDSGILSDTSYGYDAFLNYTDSAKAEVASKLLKKLPFNTLSEFKTAYDGNVIKLK